MAHFVIGFWMRRSEKDKPRERMEVDQKKEKVISVFLFSFFSLFQCPSRPRCEQRTRPWPLASSMRPWNGVRKRSRWGRASTRTCESGERKNRFGEQTRAIDDDAPTSHLSTFNLQPQPQPTASPARPCTRKPTRNPSLKLVQLIEKHQSSSPKRSRLR